ncbi:cytochrome P450 [Cutaneotrichosporon oleaginosum]|uniref:Cytochrome P450 n=1 Tax=Cutaneotrichosporon oleaginosum TaxID=879819 RepID=A0A0J0XEN9_9TREE|nr:cytochrome P450 [Cutaneotrichosporon oleaginosum]KLT39531.1 cytochrome P450 [Cutaneotrichosporon oleaginosum]TXT07070.1 hypothetical protein COLE_06401 [Cutaneotrichosporon oleaginosum]
MEGVVELARAHPILTLLSLATLFPAFLILWAYPYREYTLPYRNLPGPKPSSVFWGNYSEILKEPTNAPQTRWIADFGNAFRYRTLFGKPRICLADPVAIAHIAQHTYDYHKAGPTVYALELVLGRGLLTVEGDDHRRQRKIMSPAFGLPAIKSMHPIFMEKAWELQRKLSAILDTEEETYCSTPVKPEDRVLGTKKVDMIPYWGQMTLDIIGLAGFDYDFGALAGRSTDLADSFRDLLRAGNSPGILAILAAVIPPLRALPNKLTNAVGAAKAQTDRVAREIVQQKKVLVAAELATGEKDETLGRDLLSRVVRANMDPALRPEQRLTDEEVIAQVVTFIIAGHETTATALTWMVFRLAENWHVQKRLRDELRAFPHDNPSFDELNALPYLDKVVHEGLRLDPPVAGGVRVAAKHYIIPLGQPIRGRDGKMISSIDVPVGTDIFIRVYGNLLTFFNGARNCIGYRLTLAEMKAALFCIFRHLEVLPLPSNPEIRLKAQIVMRPLVVGEEEAGYQMPVLVRAIPDDD